jgi:hypothetical protein
MTSPAVVSRETFTHDPGCRFGRDVCTAEPGTCDRIADTHNLHRIAGSGLGLHNVGKICAVALADGASDGVLYPDIREAIRFQRHNARWYAYLRIQRDKVTRCEAASFLKMHRDADRAGLNFVGRHDEPASAMEIIPRLTVEDYQRQQRALGAGRRTR